MLETANRYDVTILGGGLAGLTLARQLKAKHPDLKLLVVEKLRYPVAEGAFKVGESTIEVGAYYLADEVGLKKHLVESHLPKFGLRFFFDGHDASFQDAIEVGPSEFFPAPGYQVDRGRLENHLAETVADLGVELAARATVRDVAIANGDHPHRVEYEQDGKCVQIETRWVVDASGRAGILKRKLNLREGVAHHINAAWFRIGAEIHVDAWCDDPAWRIRVGKLPRRWLSTNHLLGRGYWLWIIPLASGATSIGIVADPRLHPISGFNRFDLAMQWLAEHEPRCAAAIEPHREQLQDFQAIKQIAHSSKEVYSASRWAMTGESGVFLDPLYSPGIDYIAIANTQICSLIEHDLAGESISLMAARYQGIFMNLFHDNLLTYEEQYPLFGNPRVMSLKYVWDYALYWGFPALLYFNGKMTDPRFFATVNEKVETIRNMNKRMQAMLRQWDASDRDADIEPVFVNQNEISILTQLNGELHERLDDARLEARFARNVQILEDLSAEIITRVQRIAPDVRAGEEPHDTPNVQRLEGVFHSLGM